MRAKSAEETSAPRRDEWRRDDEPEKLLLRATRQSARLLLHLAPSEHETTIIALGNLRRYTTHSAHALKSKTSTPLFKPV